jgi:hypothetical protein
MNTLLRWDPISRTRWNSFKDRNELESRLATMLSTREATGDGKWCQEPFVPRLR